MKNILISIFVILSSTLSIGYGIFKLDENKNKLAPMEDFEAILCIFLGIFIPITYLLINNVN